MKISIPNNVLKILVDSPDPTIPLSDLLMFTKDSDQERALWSYALTRADESWYLA